MPTDTAAPAVDSLLVDAAEAARLCGVSRATWFSWQASGRIPPPALRAGRVVRWGRLELERWVAARCPAADRWAAVKGART